MPKPPAPIALPRTEPGQKPAAAPVLSIDLKYAFVKAIARAEAQAAQVQAAQKTLDELNAVTTQAYQALSEACGDKFTVVVQPDSEATCSPKPEPKK